LHTNFKKGPHYKQIILSNFTFVLPCIVADFFLNNEQDALIIQIYSVSFGHLLCPSSGVLYCTLGTGKIHAGFWWPLPSRVRMDSDSAWKRSSKTCV